MRSEVTCVVLWLQAWTKLEELRRLHPSVNVSMYVSARSLDALQNAIGVRLNHGDTKHTNTHREAENTHTQSDGEDEDEVEEDENLNY